MFNQTFTLNKKKNKSCYLTKKKVNLRKRVPSSPKRVTTVMTFIFIDNVVYQTVEQNLPLSAAGGQLITL